MSLSDPLESQGARNWALVIAGGVFSTAIVVGGWAAMNVLDNFDEKLDSQAMQLDQIQQAQSNMAVNAATMATEIRALKDQVGMIHAGTRDRYTAERAGQDFRIRDIILEGLTERVDKLERKVE